MEPPPSQKACHSMPALPHQRADCPLFNFHHAPLNSSLSHNLLFCPRCYCLVCDVPVSECSSWLLHCMAYFTHREWRVLRYQKVREIPPHLLPPKVRGEALVKKHGEAVVDLECEEEVNPDRGDVAFAGQGLDYRDSVKLYANFPAANNGTPTSVLSKSRQSLQLSGTLSDASQRNQVSKIWHPCQCYAHADRISSGYAVTPSPSLVRTRKESPSEASYQTGAASEDTLDDDSIEAHKRKLPVKLRLRTGEDRGNVQANANPPSKQASVLCINCKCKCVDMQSD